MKEKNEKSPERKETGKPVVTPRTDWSEVIVKNDLPQASYIPRPKKDE